MELLEEEDERLAALEDTTLEASSEDATLLAGAEDGAAELIATLELLAGVDDGAVELTATLELFAGIEDGATELTAAMELLLFGLLPDELPPPHAVNTLTNEHSITVATFFI